jgi:hypothetical protein
VSSEDKSNLAKIEHLKTSISDESCYYGNDNYSSISDLEFTKCLTKSKEQQFKAERTANVYQIDLSSYNNYNNGTIASMV